MSPNMVLLLLISISSVCEGISVEEEVTLTRSEKLALDRFRESVFLSLPHEYMKEDIYLIKWLRAKSFNVMDASAMLINALDWRKANRIDGILEERFRFSEREFPFYFDGVDVTGRPVGSADVAVYDGRRAMMTGKADEVFRYGIQALERGTKSVRDARARGLNVTQCSIIVNLKGFNVVQNACFQCIPYFVRFALDYESYYPGMVHKIFLINTPRAVDGLVQILHPLASASTRGAIFFYGSNKREWKEAIFKEIPADQIRPEFGGTKNEMDY